MTINAEEELDAAIRATASPNDWTRLDNASETSVERVDADSPTPDWRIPIAVEERHDETALLARRLDERRDGATAAARLARAARNDGD